MNPRKSANYGAVGEDSPLQQHQHQQRPRALRESHGDFGIEYGVTANSRFDRLLVDVDVPSSAGWSWWRAGLVTAAIATVLSATVGMIHFASYTGTEQPLGGSFSEGFAEKATGTSVKAAAVRDDADLVHSVRQETTTATATTLVRNAPQVQQTAEEHGQHLPAAAKEEYAEELAFTASNAYNRRGDSIGVGYPWLEGKHLVEPYRATALDVVSPVQGMTYAWNVLVAASLDKSLGEFEGESVEVMFENAPEYTVVLLEKRADGALARSLSLNVFCKYVRREIRSLFDGERNEMFDAMKVTSLESISISYTAE